MTLYGHVIKIKEITNDMRYRGVSLTIEVFPTSPEGYTEMDSIHLGHIRVDQLEENG